MNKPSRQLVDRISDLSDPILCDILYYLPTKFVATTSVLSKRWRYLWLSIIALDFDINDFKTSTLLCNAIYSTMDRRAITLPIHSFRLKDRTCFSRCDQWVVNNIVDYVVQRGIQNLDLNTGVNYDGCLKLPVTIFSCRTLKLRYTYWTEWTQLPNKFQNLTHLELNFYSALVYPRWTWLLEMLELSPKLQNLIIQDNDALKETNDVRWQNPSVVPECILRRINFLEGLLRGSLRKQSNGDFLPPNHCYTWGNPHTERTVALAVGGVAALGFFIVCLMFLKSVLKKKGGKY
ncbi:F-box/FBD/LRR-repeat protein [Trifolium repens]|nr:F-box/FBD/LRR-repeat protein [Trifolium repens]